MNRITFLLPIAFILLLFACTPSADGTLESPTSLKLDPYVDTTLERQYFEVRGDEEKVVEGREGTMIAMPKNCWVDADGNPIDGKIDIELAEAFTADLMLASNLTTTTKDGALLESDGMIFLGASHKGKPVFINPDAKPYVQIPTPEKKSGMKAYHGKRDADGNMVWTPEAELETFLTPVALSELDFLPAGYKKELKKRLPFGPFTSYSDHLADSLYFLLSEKNYKTTRYREDYLGFLGRLGKSFDLEDVYPDDTLIAVGSAAEAEDSGDIRKPAPCSVDPASIRAIKGSKFENTLIATREFEKRLQHLFNTCETGLLELYVDHIDLNLYEVDSLVYSRVDEKSSLHRIFKEYAALKETRVEGANAYAPMLKKYFRKRKERFRKESEKLHKQMRAEEKAAKEKYERIEQQYQQLVFQREKEKMQHYGYALTRTGWLDVNDGTKPRDWDEKSIEVSIDTEEDVQDLSVYASTNYDRTMVRLIKTGDNLYRTRRTDGVGSYPFHDTKTIIIRAVRLDGEQSLYAEKAIFPEKNMLVSLNVTPTPEKEIRKKIKQADRRNNLNQSIAHDLKVQAKKKEAEKVVAEKSAMRLFMYTLAKAAMPCCHNEGEYLFKQNCAACHKVDKRLIGPALKGSTERWSNNALMIDYIRNTEEFMKKYPNHEYSQQLFEEYNGTIMTTMPLTDNEIIAIMNWVENGDDLLAE